jgi:protein BCP1
MSEIQKRKNEEIEAENPETKVENEEEDDAPEIVDVDFDFFDPKEVDFHAIKNLLRQLLDSDCDSFELSTLADIILDGTSRGTTVKVDGPESDPFALVSIVDFNQHKEKPAMKTLVDYMISKTSKKPEFNRKLRQLLAAGSKSRIGLVFSERMINMPVEVVPPMYRLFLEETTSEDKPPFDYYLIVSKAFTEEESQLDLEERRPLKRGKFQNPKEVYHFHTEDDVFHEFADYHAYYEYSNVAQDSDSKRTFQDYGIFPKGHLILVKGDKFTPAVDQMTQKFAPPS